MFLKYCLLAFALMGSVMSFAQPCSSYFVTSGSIINETCSVTGAASYSISIAATSDSTIAITNLWESQGAVINANVTCMPPQFTFPMQQFYPNYLSQGSGNLQNGTNLTITYSIYNATDTLLLETCTSSVIITNEEPRRAVGLTLSPNPAHDQCRLSLQGLESQEPCDYFLMDMTGRELQRGAFGQATTAHLDLSQLPAGIFAVQVRQGGLPIAHRFLVKD